MAASSDSSASLCCCKPCRRSSRKFRICTKNMAINPVPTPATVIMNTLLTVFPSQRRRPFKGECHHTLLRQTPDRYRSNRYNELPIRGDGSGQGVAVGLAGDDVIRLCLSRP